ncbi:hypothetical protein BG015_006275 [Linnemannia schmuckeri]|uniref:Uncharacterized protein n=1 Tax=Linnemannia schmuckeri TaxID=64567 RepID=A0A9P5VBL5_9FUNG|nr:hypothetical protein BG015_006275 [Linnemannia schmuckeri]
MSSIKGFFNGAGLLRNMCLLDFDSEYFEWVVQEKKGMEGWLPREPVVDSPAPSGSESVGHIHGVSSSTNSSPSVPHWAHSCGAPCQRQSFRLRHQPSAGH